MAEDVVYRFVATGQGDVLSAFTSIADAAGRAATATEISFTKSKKAAKTTADVMKMSAKEAAAELEAIRKKENADIEKAAKRAQRALDADVAAANKAADAKIKAEKRVAQEHARAYAQIAKDYSSSLAGSIVNAVGGAMRTVSSLVTSTLSGALREGLHLDDIARRVSINSRGVGENYRDPTQLRKAFEQTAVATPGIKSEDIGEATQAYIDFTGDVDTAMSSMKTFATVASATGAAVKDVALAGASFGEKFGIHKVEDVADMFALLVYQGKGAKLTLEQMGAAAQRLAPAAKAFGIEGGLTGVAKTGGLLQIARAGTGSAAQAVTGTENILTGLKLRAKKFAGVDVYDKKTNEVRDVNAILAETIGKAGGGKGAAQDAALAKIFGRGAGLRAVNPLIGTYRDASAKAGGGKEGQKAGIEAVMAQLEKLSSVVAARADVEKDAAFAQQSSSAQLTGAWEQIKAKVGEVMPQLQGSIKKIVDAAPALAASLASLAQAAAATAEALGLYTPKSHADAANELDEKAKGANLTPEQRASFKAQAAVERAKGVSTTVDEQRETANAKFKAAFLKAGGDGIGARANAWVLGKGAQNPKGFWGEKADTIAKGYDLAGGGHKDGLNPGQMAAYKTYQAELGKIGRKPGEDGGVGKAGKVGDIATAVAAAVRAELATVAAAQNAAAKAAKEAAEAQKAAAGKGGGRTIAPGAHK